MGTKLFLAPEVFKGGSFRAKPLDVWAFGVSIYTLVFGILPFNDLKEIQEKEPNFDLSIATS